MKNKFTEALSFFIDTMLEGIIDLKHTILESIVSSKNKLLYLRKPFYKDIVLNDTCKLCGVPVLATRLKGSKVKAEKVWSSELPQECYYCFAELKWKRLVRKGKRDIIILKNCIPYVEPKHVHEIRNASSGKRKLYGNVDSTSGFNPTTSGGGAAFF